ncbi:hypothetical protein MTO96_012162 [Rhipicephalus appendiculatus]
MDSIDEGLMGDRAEGVGVVEEPHAQLPTSCPGVVQASLQHEVVFKHPIVRQEALLTPGQYRMVAQPPLQPGGETPGIQFGDRATKGNGAPVCGVLAVALLVYQDRPRCLPAPGCAAV